MAVRDYLRVLARRWKIVVACLVLGVAVALAVSALSPRRYTATADVLVSAEATSNQTDNSQGSYFAQSRVKSYVAVVTSPDVLDKVRTDLSLPLSNEQLKDRITATAQSDTTLISISATDTSPALAASIANSAARAFNSVVEQFETPADSSTSAIKLLITNPALAPSSPQSPNVPVNAAVGLFLGILVGLSAAALRELLDVTIKAPEDLATTAGAPLLAAIVSDPQTHRQPVAAKVNARGPRAEGFRQLRTNLQFVDVDHPPRVISVNSAVPGEGKTSTAVNIASALAESGARVCLIDADLRRPSVADLMGLVGTVGLTNVLIGQVPLSEALQEVGALRVLTSGALPPNPSELLAANHTRDVIRSIAADHDFVIVDTAPLLPVADGAEIAAAADGSILVARWGSTSFAQVRRSSEALERVDARLLGVVLNRVPGRFAGAYGYTYYGKRPKSATHRRGGDPGVALTDERATERGAGAAAPVDETIVPVPVSPAAEQEDRRSFAS
ncbi:polysaccharide biosynthesis tyrosine autokinase [Jatrophihabitans sp. YIM 134969]